MVLSILNNASGGTAIAASGALWALLKDVRVEAVRNYRSEMA